MNLTITTIVIIIILAGSNVHFSSFNKASSLTAQFVPHLKCTIL